MPVSSTSYYHSMHESNQNSSQINGEIPGTLGYPILGGNLSNKSEFDRIKRTRYDISGAEIEYRSGASIPGGGGCSGDGRGGGGCGPVVTETGSLFHEFGFKEAPHIFGSKKDTYPKMTRAVKEKPEGIGESLTWLKRELMDLRNTDQELTRTLFTLQSKIRDLKNKINQDEVDDECDGSEKNDYPSSWSSSGQRNDSFSSISGSPPSTNGINVIKEESDEEPVMEFKHVKQVNEMVTVTRSSVDKATPAGDFTTSKCTINGNSMPGSMILTTTINHNANGYSRNTNNSLDQVVRAPVSFRDGVTSDGVSTHSRIEKPSVPPPPVNKRKSLSSDGIKNSSEKPIVPPPPVNKRKSLTSDGLKNSSEKPSAPPPQANKRKSLTDGLKNPTEKPSLPPPPPPPVSTSPTPSLKSTSSSEVVHRFVMKEDSKRDSMSSSSFVSSSSSFTSSLEELRLQDVSRDLRSSGRSFDRMTFEEEEEEEENVVNQDELASSVKDKDDVVGRSMKFSLFNFDDNGNEGKVCDETSEASRMMESIWAEATMFS